MLVDTNIAIAVRCKACGSLKIYNTTLFKLFANNRTELECDCGQQIAIVKTKDLKNLSIYLDCFTCNNRHLFQYSIKQILRGDIINRCKLTGVEVCFILKSSKVNRIEEKPEMNMREFYNELGLFDYFSNTEIMLSSIDRVKELDSKGLVNCSCGDNNIEMNLFFDRIELRCMKCSGIKLIYAENDEDYHNLINKEEIVIHENSFECIDAINQNRDTKK